MIVVHERRATFLPLYVDAAIADLPAPELAVAVLGVHEHDAVGVQQGGQHHLHTIIDTFCCKFQIFFSHIEIFFIVYSTDLLLVLVLEDGHPQAVGAAATELARHHLADSVYS